MKALRSIIRKMILESEGIDWGDVWQLMDREGNKRYMGAYAKDIFRREADRDFLDSLGYIHSIPFSDLDSRLTKLKSKDELSCLITQNAWQGEEVWDVAMRTGEFMNENSVGLIIDGWVTWATNRNANSGHTGSLIDQYGDRPHSGIPKAPGKTYHMHRSSRENPGGGSVPQHELDRVLMDTEDMEEKGLHFSAFDQNNQRWFTAKNNEAILDNWTVIGVCHVVAWSDEEKEAKLTPEYDAKIMDAYNKIKKKWPKAELVKVFLD